MVFRSAQLTTQRVPAHIEDRYPDGLFFTSNDFGGTLSIADTTMTGNTGGSWTSVKAGAVTNAGTAVATNCKSITVANSTLQGYP